MVNVSALREAAERIPRSQLKKVQLRSLAQYLFFSFLARLTGLLFWVGVVALIVAIIVLGYVAPKRLLFSKVSEFWALSIALAWTVSLFFVVFSSKHISRIGAMLSSSKDWLEEKAHNAYSFKEVLRHLRIKHKQKDLLLTLTPETPVQQVLKIIQQVGDEYNHNLIALMIREKGSNLFRNWSTEDLLKLLFAIYPYDEALEHPFYNLLHDLIETLGRKRGTDLIELLIRTEESNRGILPRGGGGVLTWLYYQRYVDGPLGAIFKAEGRPIREPWFLVKSE